MFKKNGLFLGTIAIVCLIGSSLSVAAAEPSMYEVISKNEDLLPGNMTIQARVSITYDHTAGTESDDHWITRYCWGRTQAKQGSINLSSYTRARFEGPFGMISGDSGRVWSKTEGGPSYAKSGTETADIGSPWVAHTYYGTTD